MSEKRFRANFDVSIYDSEKEEYISVRDRGLEEIAKRMNEQQATITKLKELNDDKGKRIISLIRTNKTLKEENEQLKNRLNKGL